MLPVYAIDNPAEEDNLAGIEDKLELSNSAGRELELEDIDEASYDGFVYKLSDDVTRAEVREMNREIKSLDGDAEAGKIVDDYYSADSIETISEIVDSENVEYVEPNYYYYLDDYDVASIYGTSEDYKFYDYQKRYLSLIGANDVWNKGVFGKKENGEPVVVAVIDSLYSSSNPDIADSLLPGINTNNLASATVGDDGMHGTRVSSVIAAKHDDYGIVGLMPEVKLLPIRAFYSKYDASKKQTYVTASSTEIIKALKAVEENDVDVVNMSFTLASDGRAGSELQEPRSIGELCSDLEEDGVILVAASGNFDSTADMTRLRYPAACDSVIGVGSVNSSGVWASSYSVANNSVFVSAPGSNVPIPDNSSSTVYSSLRSGTSFASHMVAALAAMCKSLDPEITTDEFEELLIDTSVDKGDVGYDTKYGYGVINFANVYAEFKNIKDYNFEVDDQSYTGEAIEPQLVVDDLIAGEDYSVTYSDNIAVGKAKAEITGIGKYVGTQTIYFNIVPKGTRIYSSRRAKRSITVRWRRQTEKMSSSRISGYVVQISRDEEFKSGVRSSVRTGYSKYSKKFTGLKKRTNYYARVRTYKRVGGKKYYSAWSEVKRIRTK